MRRREGHEKRNLSSFINNETTPTCQTTTIQQAASYCIDNPEIDIVSLKDEDGQEL